MVVYSTILNPLSKVFLKFLFGSLARGADTIRGMFPCTSKHTARWPAIFPLPRQIGEEACRVVDTIKLVPADDGL
jgi:hypothetical protein